MSQAYRSSKKRPVPQFLYAPASKWTLNEYEFLNVDDDVRPWREMLSVQPEDAVLQSDPLLQRLLDSFQKKARLISEQDIVDLRKSGQNVLARFYLTMMDIVSDTDEDDLDRDLIENTPSPKEIKRVRYSRTAKPSTSLSEGSIPKSNSLQSISSVSSDKQGQREGKTRTALFHLLDYISDYTYPKFSDLLIDPNEYVGEINTKFSAKPIRVENDGSIRRSKKTFGALPFLNIECKSGAGSSSSEMYLNIFAQEFGEMLAIMLGRVNAMMYRERTESDMSFVVYSIGVHHRRAYLAKVEFGSRYLHDCNEGVLDKERVTVFRSEQNYRLDDIAELREFVTMIYCLCSQFVDEIQAGRVV